MMPGLAMVLFLAGWTTGGLVGYFVGRETAVVPLVRELRAWLINEKPAHWTDVERKLIPYLQGKEPL